MWMKGAPDEHGPETAALLLRTVLRTLHRADSLPARGRHGVEGQFTALAHARWLRDSSQRALWPMHAVREMVMSASRASLTLPGGAVFMTAIYVHPEDVRADGRTPHGAGDSASRRGRPGRYRHLCIVSDRRGLSIAHPERLGDRGCCGRPITAGCGTVLCAGRRGARARRHAAGCRPRGALGDPRLPDRRTAAGAQPAQRDRGRPGCAAP
jgi:hypothetical protein